MALWTPDLLSPAWWIHPPDRTTITASGGYVSAAADKGSYGRDAVQGDPAKQPQDYIDAIGNSGVALRHLNAPFGGIADGSQNSYTLFVVATPAESCGSWPAQGSSGSNYFTNDSYNNNALRVNGNNATTSGPVAPILSVSTNGIALCETRNSLAPYNISRQVTVSSGGPGVVEIDRSPGSLQSRVNFGAAANGVASAVNNLTWTSIDVPAIYAQASGSYNGKIHSVLLFFGTLSTGDRQRVEGWIAWEFDLTGYLDAGHPYKSAPPEMTSVVLAAWSEQQYGDVPEISATLSQIYSMLLEVWSAQIYSDVPLLQKQLLQPYRDASMLQRELLQRWGATLEMEVGLTQPWAMPESLTTALVQEYGIAAAVLQATSEQLYHIHANSELFADLVQPYAMAAEAAALYIFDCRLYADGERVPYITCDWQATKSEYAWHLEFSVKKQEVAIKCAAAAELTLVCSGDTYRFKPMDGWRLDKRLGETVYRIEAWSPTRALDLAPPLTGEYSGMASVIAADLAAPFGIAIDWQLVDGYIAPGKLTASDETPLAVLRKLVADGDRGRLQTAADGSTLLCVCEVETAVPAWRATVPAQVVDARIERRATTWQDDVQPGHNHFYVSDQLAAGQSERLIDQLLDSRTADVRLYVTPLDPTVGYTLEHSGSSQVSIEPMGIVSETIVDELVEIKGGIGQTSLPIYGVVARSWQAVNLGDIVTGEDGIVRAAIAGYSLLRLSYVTRFHQWLARDPNIEEVQFVARRVS